MRPRLAIGAPYRSPRLRYAGRKGLIVLLVAIAIGAIPLADRVGLFGEGRVREHDRYDGKTFHVTHVVDGDTLDVDVADDLNHRRTTRIRLWGVDTPETVDPRKPKPDYFGPEASAFTKGLAGGQDVRLELDSVTARDKYQRLLAYVYLPDGRMLNRVLVEEGYAYADPRFPHKYKREFQNLMKQAKTGLRGLWKGVRAEDLPYYLQNEKLPAR